MTVSIEPLTAAHSAEVAAFTCSFLLQGSSLHRALKVQPAVYAPYLDSWLGPSLDQALSLAARDTASGELLGCLVARDFDSSLPNAIQPPQALEPMSALLHELGAQYRRVRNPQAKTVLVDYALVAPAAAGQGLYRALRMVLHDAAAERGFVRVVGELSSAATQKVCINDFAHVVRGEIAFADFVWRGQTPFASINEPPALLLVEGELL